jgi:hypothetical protein
VGRQLLDAGEVLPHGSSQARFGLAVGQVLSGIVTLLGGVTGEVLGGAATTTGIGAAVGLPTIAVSTTFVVGGFANIAAGLSGLPQAMMSGGSGSGSSGASAAPASAEVNVSKSRFPQSAQHIEDAQAAGKPSTLTIDRGGAAARRRQSLSGTEKKPGLDRDEYPPAMFSEGSQGASVRPIAPGDNRGAGACIGAQCRGLPDGSRVEVKVTK